MDPRRAAPPAGAAVCAATVVVLAAPFVLIEGHGRLVGDYYAAGPFGAGGVGFLATLGVVVFLSADRGTLDPETMAGLLLVLGVGLVGLAAAWYVSVDAGLLFSFPPEYAWIERHPGAVLAVSSGAPVVAAGYARAVVG